MKKYILLIILIGFKLFGQDNTENIAIEESSNTDNINQNVNLVSNEKQKFNNFKKSLKSVTSEEYLNKMRIYSKDSLKTLAIKLLSIKELKEKKLLQKDILLNSDYYIRLLDELKSSKINNTEYFFLEKELNNYNLIRIKNKYTISVIINFILGIIALILFYKTYLTKYQKKILKIEELSVQEKNIKNLILSGKSNKEIAAELFISLNTVKTHITNIYNKLNISNRKDLITKFQK
ncbi:response regulator transcription factor [Kordia sp.]|uniref:response regulator transcription factor n=1 Tax=Kordia sp. TaxID=1965332 RepID=UPI003D2AB8B5